MYSKVNRAISVVGMACVWVSVYPGCTPIPGEVSYPDCAGDGGNELPAFSAGPGVQPASPFAGAAFSVVYEACTKDPATVVLPAFTDRIEILRDDEVILTEDVRSEPDDLPGEDLGGGCYSVSHEFANGLDPGTYTLRITLDINEEAINCPLEPHQVEETEFTVDDPQLTGGGPVEPPTDNTPPEADAGPDQIVRPEDPVALDASGGIDPDGDPLTFAWTQLDGTPINLAGANSSTPSFNAPLSTGILVFELTVFDGEGGSDSDVVEIDVDLGATLYVANTLGNTVLAFDAGKPHLLDGNRAPDALLGGDQTSIDTPLGVFLDAAGALLVVSENSPAAAALATAYADAENFDTLDGNNPPDRTVTLGQLSSGDPSSWVGGVEQDMLFITDDSTQSILVFQNVSTPGFDEAVAPARQIMGSSIATPWGMHLDPAQNLYVANGGFNNIAVFASAPTLDGFQLPTRTLSCNEFTKPVEVYIDANDTLYVVNEPDQVLAFEGASVLTGEVTPDRVVTIPGAGALADLAIDSQGHAYILDRVENAIYGYDFFDVIDGTEEPLRVIEGPATGLNGAISLHLVE